MVKYLFETLKFVLRILIFQLFYRTLKIIFYVLNNNYSCIQLSFVSLLKKNSDFDHDYTDPFFFFFFRNIFISALGLFSPFFFFFFRKILVPSLCFFWKLFFVFLIIFINHFNIYIKNYKIFLNSYLPFTYIQKNYKKCFL